MAILRAVMQKLSRRLEADHPLTAASDPVLQRYGLLHQLQHQRQLLEVTPAGYSNSYQSMILAIDAARGLLWLDDLFPSQRLLELGDVLHIQHHFQGEVLAFDAAIVAWGASYGASGFAVTLPEDISYQPRRRLPRWEVPAQQPLSAKIRSLGEAPIYARVINLSAGGVRLAIPGNLLAQLRHGSLLPLCEIPLEPRFNIRCKARIKAFRLEREPYRHTQVSLEFEGMDPAQRQRLQTFVERHISLASATIRVA